MRCGACVCGVVYRGALWCCWRGAFWSVVVQCGVVRYGGGACVGVVVQCGVVRALWCCCRGVLGSCAVLCAMIGCDVVVL